MASKALQMLTVLVFLLDGHAPRLRELRNPDAEGGGLGARIVLTIKRIDN